MCDGSPLMANLVPTNEDAGLSPRIAFKPVDSHPLLIPDVEPQPLGPPLVNRPIWAQRSSELNHNGYQTHALPQSLDNLLSNRPFMASLDQNQDHDLDESSISSSFDDRSENQTESSSIREKAVNDPLDYTTDEANAEFTRIRSHVVGHPPPPPPSSSSSVSVTALPAFVAPQPRVPHAWPSNMRSSCQTPIPKNPARAYSRTSQRDGALSPFRKNPPWEGSQPSRPESIAPTTMSEAGEEQVVRPSLDLLMALHRMSTDELESQLGLTAPSPLGLDTFPRSPQTVENSTTAPTASPATPVSSGQSIDKPRRSDPPHSERLSPQVQAGLLEMVRCLSQALSEALDDAAKSKASAIKERSKHLEAVEYLNQQSEARELALTNLCLQHGIKEGEISRCLLRAPVLDAEASKNKRKKEFQVQAAKTAGDISLSIPHGESNLSALSTKEFETASLPQSLQEAMLEDLDGVFGASSIKAYSPSIKASSFQSSSHRDRSPSTASTRTDVSFAPSTKRKTLDDPSLLAADSKIGLDGAGASPITHNDTNAVEDVDSNGIQRPKVYRSVSAARITNKPTSSSSTLGDWASGLMPWAASGSNKKAVASTAASKVKAMSPSRHTDPSTCVSRDVDPFDSPPRSKSAAGMRNEPNNSDTPLSSAKSNPTRHARSLSTLISKANIDQVKPSSRSGLGILGTLTWRKKRPSLESSDVDRPTDDVHSTAHIADTSVETVTSPGFDSTSTDSKVSQPADSRGKERTDDNASTSQRKEAVSGSTENQSESTVSIPSTSNKEDPPLFHEPIGSESTSPLTDRLPGALPKPFHFKAIFLATRVMTPDPSSLLYDSGKQTSKFIADLAMSLVGRAREEGKMVEEFPKGNTAHRPSTSLSRPLSMAQVLLSQAAEGQVKRTSQPPQKLQPQPQPSLNAKVASSTTFARAFGRYTKPPAKDSQGRHLEPNVTRLPNLYQFSTATETEKLSADTTLTTSVDDEPMPSQPRATVVELEPIVPMDAAPPTMVRRKKKTKRDFGVTSSLSSSSSSSSSKKSMTKSLVKLDTLDEESSGDEFEVYGGKGQVPGYGKSEVSETEDDENDDDDDENETGLLTDRYGFIYDATPTDIRLLRQARKAATPAPACLTGIRVGVRARGGTDSQSEEDKEDPDLNEADTDDESSSPLECKESQQLRQKSSRTSLNQGSVEQPSQQQQLHEQDSTAVHETAFLDSEDGESTLSSGGKKVVSKKDQGMLLSLAHCKPMTEPLSVSATSQSTSNTGPTSPTEESDFQNLNPLSFSSSEEPNSISTTTPTTSKNSSWPTTSQTVRRLLSQLKDMHETQQTEQKTKWDEFLQRRRERLIRVNVETVGLNGESVSSSSSLTLSSSSSSAMRKSLVAIDRSGAAGLSLTEKTPEEDWNQGMVGINQMGGSKAGKEDWKDFLTLCQAGIPLCYRAKIWAECSGANEVAEPGKYHELLNEHQGETNQCLTQIDLDVHRTMPTNIYFGGDGQGIPKLRRLLVAYSWYNPTCGYCQGMNNLAATLLLTHATEEEAFWVLVCIIEKILPSEYYTSHLLVSQADQRVLIDLVEQHMPALYAHIIDLGVDLPAVTFAWFLSLYTDCLPVETLFRVWDVMFVEGMVILFRVAIAILKTHESDLLATSSAAAFYGQVHSMTSRMFSVDRLIQLACDELKPVIRYASILEKRERHVADLTRELGLDLAAPTSST